MTQQSDSRPPSTNDDFARQASARSSGVVGEFLQFLKERKKWWLLPILLVLLGLGALIVLAGTGLAPFIYTLF